MKSTKTLILEAARSLFNQSGTASVSTHSIAAEAGISQGNLTYHFPQKTQIIERLYFNMVGELEHVIQGFVGEKPGLQAVFHWTGQQIHLQMHYRFLWLEFAHIRHQYPNIDEHFSEMVRQRQYQFGSMLDMLEQTGELIAPTTEEEQTWIFQQILVLGNFWLHASEVFTEESDPILYYSKLTLSPLLPYLSAKGKETWDTMKS